MPKSENIPVASSSSKGALRDVEVVGPVGNARFRMTPLDVQRVQDLFVAHDTLQAMKLAA